MFVSGLDCLESWMKWPISLCWFLEDSQSSSYVTYATTLITKLYGFTKLWQIWIQVLLIILMRYHRYQWCKCCIRCCIITALSHPLGPCGVYWALVLLGALSTLNQWREPVQQHFDRVNLIDVAALVAFVSFVLPRWCDTLLHGRESKLQSANLKGLFTAKRWSLCQGGLGRGIYDPEIAAFLIHRELPFNTLSLSGSRG